MRGLLTRRSLLIDAYSHGSRRHPHTGGDRFRPSFYGRPMPPRQRRTNVWRRVTSPAPGARRLRGEPAHEVSSAIACRYEMKAIGNLILMTLICVFVFIVFMAIRPARAALAIHAMGSAIFDRRLRARAHSAGLSGAAAARSLCLCQRRQIGIVWRGRCAMPRSDCGEFCERNHPHKAAVR